MSPCLINALIENGRKIQERAILAMMRGLWQMLRLSMWH